MRARMYQRSWLQELGLRLLRRCAACALIVIPVLDGCLTPSGSSSTSADMSDDDTPTPIVTPSPHATVTPTPEPTATPEDTVSPNPSETSTPTPSGDSSCEQLIPGAPVGLACIHCLHPNAHEQARALVQIMRQSCRQNLVTNVLIDGRFSVDDAFLTDLLQTLTENRNVTVFLYLTNGVSQRLRDPFDPEIFGTGTTVESFRHAIVSDAGFRLAYQHVAQRAVDVASNVNGNLQVVLVPGLEDNFTDSVFENVLELTREVGGNQVLYGRNPCPNCADGNGTGIPSGVIEEEHSGGRFHTRNGMVTNDNTPYRFSFEQGGGTSIDQMRGLKLGVLGQNDMFILWTASYQGLPVSNNQIVGRPPPDQRNYAYPTSEQAAELIEFLR
ncbi:MAG: hypothetical protein U0136_04130 [Bdellovibrionota bacterium]